MSNESTSWINMLEDEQWCLGSKISDPRKCVFNTSLQFTKGEEEEASQVCVIVTAIHLYILASSKRVRL